MKKKLIAVLILLSCLALTSCQLIGVLLPLDNDSPQSILTGSTWTTTGDKSQIHFLEDGKFRYYRYPHDLTDNYYEGTYDFYLGTDAVKYLTEDLAEYGVTADEWQRIIDGNYQYTNENTAILILHNETCIVGGENTVKEPYDTPYMGFFLEDQNTLDLANMKSANYITFIKDTQ